MGGPSRSSVQIDRKKNLIQNQWCSSEKNPLFSAFILISSARWAKHVSILRLVLNQIHVLCFWKSEKFVLEDTYMYLFCTTGGVYYTSHRLVSFVCLCGIHWMLLITFVCFSQFVLKIPLPSLWVKNSNQQWNAVIYCPFSFRECVWLATLV